MPVCGVATDRAYDPDPAGTGPGHGDGTEDYARLPGRHHEAGAADQASTLSRIRPARRKESA